MKYSITFVILAAIIIGLASCQKANRRDEQYQKILQYKENRVRADSLYPFLRDKDELVRGLAVQALGEMQDTTAVDTLAQNLNQGSIYMQEKAAVALGLTGSAYTSRTLSGKIENTLMNSAPLTTSVRTRIISALGVCGTENSAVFIRQQMEDKNELVAEKACIAAARLAMRGITHPSSDSALIPLLSHQDAMVRWKAAYAMMRIRKPVFAAYLMTSIKDEDESVRMNAARALGLLNDSARNDSLKTAIIDALLETASNDASWMVRVNAVNALGQFKFKSDDLKKVYFLIAFEGKKDPDEHVRLSAIRAMANSYKQDIKNPKEFIATITGQFALSATWREKTAILGSLSAMFGKSVLDHAEWLNLLQSCMRDSQRYCRAQAVEALYPAADDKTIPFYSQALSDSFDLVQLNALNGIGKIRTNKSRPILITALKTKKYTNFMTALSALSDDPKILTDKKRCDSIVLRAVGIIDSLRPFDDDEAMMEMMKAAVAFKSRHTETFLNKFINHPKPGVAKYASEKIKECCGRDVLSGKEIHKKMKTVDYVFLSKLKSQSPVAVIRTEKGDMDMEFHFDEAPLTVIHFVKLAEKQYFNGQYFHRVVPNFVVQTGDPTGTGWGGPGYSVVSEFSGRKFERGSVGMASAGKDTEGSQWFICHSPQPHLEGRYTVFGKIIKGMEIIDRIQVGDKILSLDVVRF